jgi:hypothetical protein
MRSVNLIKHYQYPGTVEDIIDLVKTKDSQLYAKWIENKMILKKRF